MIKGVTHSPFRTNLVSFRTFVPYSQNFPRPISWFGLSLQQNDSRTFYFSHSGPEYFLKQKSQQSKKSLTVLKQATVRVGRVVFFLHFSDCTEFVFDMKHQKVSKEGPFSQYNYFVPFRFNHLVLTDRGTYPQLPTQPKKNCSGSN